MTQERINEIKAINRFMFHSWNYEVVSYTRHNGKVVYIPRFVAEVKWTCGTEHIIDKWFKILTGTPHAFLSIFYSYLDSTNRALLLDWILDNYTDEQRILD